MQAQATIKATEAQLKEILDVTSVGYHEELYLNIDDDRVRLLGGAPDSSSGVYNDFVEAFVEEINGSAEAYIDVAQFENYLSVLSGGPSTVLEVTFLGTDGERLANQVKISPEDGSGEVSLMLKSGERVMESVPTALPKQFDQNNNFLHPVEDRPAKVHIETYVDEVRRIIDAVNLQESMEYAPIVVKSQQFILDVGDENDERVNVNLKGDVSNDDDHNVDNVYGGSFSDVINTLSGTLFIQVEDGAPIHLLQEKNHITIRHLIGTARAV